LAVALSAIGPVLRRLGITEVRYSGAYAYRRSKTGRLSLHAHGLAIDVHGFVVGGRRLTVERDYRRGLRDGCSPTAPVLNRVACALRETGRFAELLTPDYDADHRDHFHLAIAPVELGGDARSRVARVRD
jgi:hypothetical protein